MSTDKNNNKKGAALIVIVMVFAVLMVVGTAALKIMTTETELAMNSYDQSKAYYLAKSGADATAAYIIDNPDEIDTLTNNPGSLITGTGLDNAGSFQIEVNQTDDNVEIISTGTVNSGVKSTVTLNLEKSSSGFMPEAALYINDYATLDNSGEINGDIVLAKNDVDLVFKKKQNILKDGEIICTDSCSVTFQQNKNKIIDIGCDSSGNAEIEFPLPDFPSLPEFTKYEGNRTPSELKNGTYYTSGLYFGNNRIVTVNVGNEDVVIRTKSFEMFKATLNINKTGSGKFIMYIEAGDNVEINKSTLNSGSSEDVVIYYQDEYGEFNVGTNSSVHADLFVEATSLDMSQGNTEFSGQIIFKGTEDWSYVNMSQGITLDNTLIYAPESIVYLEQHIEMTGSLIAGISLISNSSSVEYAEIGGSYILETELSADDLEVLPGEPSYKKTNYK